MKIRKAVRALLLNEDKELLLMEAEDFNIRPIDGEVKKSCFWFTVGGKIENNESFHDALVREIYEETGLKDIEIGPNVWNTKSHLLYKNEPIVFDEIFVVVHTKQKQLSFENFTYDEKQFIKRLRWWSLEDILQSTEIIYPIILKEYLPDILKGNYPKIPLDFSV